MSLIITLMAMMTKHNTLIAAFAAAGLLTTASAGEELDLRPEDEPAACGASPLQVEAVVHGVTPVGILTVEIYEPSERHFLRSDSRLKRVRVAAEDGPQSVCFDIPGPGEYALAAYHDINANRKLDRRWNRMPAEPFALSNNQELRMRMPRFEEAAIEVDENGAVVELVLEER